jgi:hypothetical protein
MKMVRLMLGVSLILGSTGSACAKSSLLSGIKSLSVSFLGAYGVSMGLLGLHEFAHAITAKAFYNSPIDITLGVNLGDDFFVQKTLVKLPGLKIGGLNPFAGFARCFDDLKDQHKYHPLKHAAICLAGPVASVAGSMAVIKYGPQNRLMQWAAKTHLGLISLEAIGACLFGEKRSDVPRAISEFNNYFKTNKPALLQV